MSSIFGGSKSKSKSYNRSYDQLSGLLSPLISQGTRANDAVFALLGGDSSGFDAYKNAINADFEIDRGIGAINSNSAGRGVFRSGARDKAAGEFYANIQNRFADNYMQRLLGISGQGLQASGVVAGAGQVGESSSRSKPGIGGFLGGLGSTVAASDKNCKKNIVRIGTLGEIGIYLFNYIHDEDEEPLRVGVMAQEVKESYPDALGPVTIDGFMTVDYGKLKEAVEEAGE